MTFNKERHPDPEEHRHFLSFDNLEGAEKLLSALQTHKNQKSLQNFNKETGG